MVTNLAQFLLAVLVISATPGPAVALVIRRTALRGVRYGLAVVAGLELGLYVWALLVAAGFAVVAASQAGYLALKIIGCAVLVGLAMRSLRAWWNERRHPTTFEPRCDETDLAPSRGTIWAIGEGSRSGLPIPKRRSSCSPSTPSSSPSTGHCARPPRSSAFSR